MASERNDNDPFAGLVDLALGKVSAKARPQVEAPQDRGISSENMDKFFHKQKVARRKELSGLRTGAEGWPGKPDATVELSDVVKPLVGYVRDYHAHHQTSGEEELDKRTVKNLALGTESMASTRQKLNRGRGNVDSENPLFPEAAFRTAKAFDYQRQHNMYSNDFMEQAAIAETMRAGNCDQHAAVNMGYLSDKFGWDTTLAKASNTTAHHTFAELRGAKGKTEVNPRDVIVDSWTGGSHAVLRQDSRFAVNQSASKVATNPGSYTDTTMDKIGGLFAAQKRANLVQSLQGVGAQIDVQAQMPINRQKVKAQWAESQIAKDAPLQTRKDTFNKGSEFTKAIQTIHAARQLGASVRGAAKLSNTEFSSAKRVDKSSLKVNIPNPYA